MPEHWGSVIYWNALSWEAFAALMAVAAAGLVGFRQVGIQRRQVELQALSVKEALWERRVAVYDAVKEFLGVIVMNGRVPGRSSSLMKSAGIPPANQEIASTFFRALDRSQFLFSQDVCKRLAKIADEAERLGSIHSSADAFYEPTKTPLEEEARAIRERLVNHYNDVASIFGEELVLTR